MWKQGLSDDWPKWRSLEHLRPYIQSRGRTSAKRISGRTSFVQASFYPPKLDLNLSKRVVKTFYLKIRSLCIRKYVYHNEILTQLKQRSKVAHYQKTQINNYASLESIKRAQRLKKQAGPRRLPLISQNLQGITYSSPQTTLTHKDTYTTSFREAEGVKWE